VSVEGNEQLEGWHAIGRLKEGEEILVEPNKCLHFRQIDQIFRQIDQIGLIF